MKEKKRANQIKMSRDITIHRYMIAQSKLRLNEHQTAAVKGPIVSHCEKRL